MAHDHHVYMLLTEAASQLRDPAALARYVPRLAALAARDGHRLYSGIAERAQAVAHTLAGDHVQAEASASRALDLFTLLGTPWQLGRTFVVRAEAALGRQDPAAARADYARALSAFESLNAQPDLERTRQALASLDG